MDLYFSSAKSGYDKEKIKRTRAGLNPYVYPDVNWHNLIFKKHVISENINLNVSGGSDWITYFLNASIRRDKGLYRKFKNKSLDINENNMHYTFQNNIAADVTPSTHMSLKVNAHLRNYFRPDVNTGTLFTQTMKAPPVEFPAYFPRQEGDQFIHFGNNVGGPHSNGLYDNPLALYARGIRRFNYATVKAVFKAEQDFDFFVKGLQARALVSFRDFSRKRNNRWYDPNYFRVKNTSIVDGLVKYSTTEAGSLNNGLLHYTHSFTGSNIINIHGVLDYEHSFLSKNNISATAIYLLHNRVVSSADLPFRNMGISGRLRYNYDHKYFGEFDVGYTGSANFAEGKRFGFFPSYAVGYLISNEKYFEPLTDIVNKLKVRASFGYVGNAKTSLRFPYITTVNLNEQDYTFGRQFRNHEAGPQIAKYGTPVSTWERAKKLDIGIDLGFLHSIKLSADYFHEDRTGIFMRRRTIPYSVGIGTAKPFGNIGEVVNKGVDASLTIDYQKGNFIVSFKGTFTYAHNEVRNRDVPYNVQPFKSPIGKPLRSFVLLHADGLLRQRDFNNGVKRNSFGRVDVGDIKYIDLDQDKQLTNEDEYRTYATSLPQMIYGFGPSIQYKRFDFSFFFQGAAKVHLRISGIHPFGPDQRNLLQFVADNHWSKGNPNYNALYPRLSQNKNLNDIRASDYWLRNAAYLRLKRAEVGCSFRNIRLFLRGTNLLTFSPFHLWDPELGGGNGLGYPPVKTINLGIQLSIQTD